MKYIKTYGINGLLEWHGQITSGGIKMNISFTNGSVTAYGVAPATFTTKNEFTQCVIEGSDEFKGGRIRLVSQTALEDDSVATEANGNGAAKSIKVADKAEAVEWLKENYPDKGYTGIKLRSKEAFDAACAECGVTFEIQA